MVIKAYFLSLANENRSQRKWKCHKVKMVTFIILVLKNVILSHKFWIHTIPSIFCNPHTLCNYLSHFLGLWVRRVRSKAKKVTVVLNIKKKLKLLHPFRTKSLFFLCLVNYSTNSIHPWHCWLQELGKWHHQTLLELLLLPYLLL